MIAIWENPLGHSPNGESVAEAQFVLNTINSATFRVHPLLSGESATYHLSRRCAVLQSGVGQDHVEDRAGD
jgi:hypothetical protein